MTLINRLKVDLAGNGPVGPSVSTFFFTGSMTGIPAAVLAFYTAIQAQLPTGMQVTVPGSGDVLSDQDGALTAGWTASGGGTLVAAGGTVYHAGVGYRCVHDTFAVHKHRRVRGSTFIVPIVGGLGDSAGTINNATISTTQTALNTLLAAVTPRWVIWSRPTPPGGTDGVSNQVMATTAVDKVSTLRSRRT